MKEYKVYLYYDIRGDTYVKAENKEDAMAKVLSILEKDGIENMVIDINDREYGAVEAEGVEDDI